MALGSATSEDDDIAGDEFSLLKKDLISGEECAPAGDSVWKTRPCSDGRSSLAAESPVIKRTTTTARVIVESAMETEVRVQVVGGSEELNKYIYIKTSTVDTVPF